MIEHFPWRVLGASVPGKSHSDNGTPGQDASDWHIDEHLFCLAVADGAGSRDHSERGSTVAVRAAVRLVRERPVQGAGSHPAATLHLLHLVMARVRDELVAVAASDDADLREYDTTLAVAIGYAGLLGVAQIGDTIAVVGGAGDYRTVSPPPRFEYANETDFLTRSTYANKLRLDVIPAGDLDLVVLSTDGMRYKLLGNVKTFEPYAPFFEDVKAYAQQPDVVPESVGRFLDRIDHDQTRDDKTLAVAVRLTRQAP